MCLIVFAWRVHPRYPLLMLANRDEFHARPAEALARWAADDGLCAGRDLQSGGTWLGVHEGGRLAAVTNVREPSGHDPMRSRGELTLDFLQGRRTAADHARALHASAADYAGFNLLLWDGSELHYCSNRPRPHSHAVAPGIHGLSNAQLDTPWPKVERSRRQLTEWLAAGGDDLEPLMRGMMDATPADDAELPDTGVGLLRERLLSPPFIRTPEYGTRCTTLVAIDWRGQAHMVERSYDEQGRVNEVRRHDLRIGGQLTA